MSNPLVAGPIDTATPFSGAGILDSGTQLAEAIESGDWVMGGLAAFSTAADTVATVSDPLGSLIGAGLGWLMDHMEPLKGWMNDLTGDAGEVAGFAQTWSNMEAQLDSAAQELERVVGDLDELAGQAIDAYRRFQADSAEHIRAAGRWAGAMATGLEVASTIVQVVHDLVRDVLSQLVGSAISWAAEAVFSLGLATPWIIEQVSTRVASLAAKVGSKVTAVLQSCKSLMKLLDELKVLLRNAGDLFDKVLKGGKSAAHSARESVAALPGVRRLDPRRKKLIQDMEDWAAQAQIPGYHPFGGLDGDEFIDTHLRRFTESGYPDWRWPGENGFDTSKTIVPGNQVAPPGTILDRISPVRGLDDTGEFASPPGTGFPTQSLPPDRLSPPFQHYQLEVVKPLPDEVRFGHIAPDFQQPGGGYQFHFPGGIAQWIESGHIRVK
ncbi:MAG: TNT domain-containing protein [Microbacterium sp.]|uniref:TNT domain-containing protein n=1 Tax=Microbacterium sp. TaxID=51671 RepID=UPI00261DB665|nr:TNT domain-containing protein [Microbacterium sp.]MCX6502553.1 TNT domain-containing protein [Microbacterium sp.]